MQEGGRGPTAGVPEQKVTVQEQGFEEGWWHRWAAGGQSLGWRRGEQPTPQDSPIFPEAGAHEPPRSAVLEGTL
jgi:hypothetical protein